MREYVLVAQDQREVDVFQRDKGWQRERLTEGALHVKCLGTEIPLETLYEGVAPSA